MARRRRPAPLPVRDGLNPTRLALPHGVAHATLVDHLVARFPDDAARLRRVVAAGEVVDELGRPYTLASAYPAGGLAYLYREPPREERVPFEVTVLHRDDDVVVVDKPHFLASTPRGAWVVETVLVRLRRELDLPELSPAHRLDRLTAGVLLLTTRRELRGPYQRLFAQRRVRKVYEAVAPYRPDLTLPVEVANRLEKRHGTLQTQVVAGEVNAVTHVEMVERLDESRARYRLEPRTGRTHQLRVHMAGLGAPIEGDDLYPDVRAVAPDDYSRPLRLLARELAIPDPVTGVVRTFVSRRSLTGPGG